MTTAGVPAAMCSKCGRSLLDVVIFLDPQTFSFCRKCPACGHWQSAEEDADMAARRTAISPRGFEESEGDLEG
jgi:hypothetical protein